MLSIKPIGIYTKVGLYLTFSSQGWYYGNNESLEVELYFDLPNHSIVHDSWLWIGEDIIKGKIIDQWTAAAIFLNYIRV